MAGVFLWGWDATNEEWVKCVVNADGKLIINPTGFLENPPTEDEANKAPTSEWAFDHDADTDAHHARYTDAEATASINDVIHSSGVWVKPCYLNFQPMYRIQKFSFQYGWGDDYILTREKPNGLAIVRTSCQETGVGFVNFTEQHYLDGAYKEVITEVSFQTNLVLFLEGTPTEDEDEKAPTSEWAFDHDADADAHHVKFTAKEAVDAFYSRVTTLTTGTYTDTDVSAISYIKLDTGGGDITLKGLDGGYNGQLIQCVKTSDSNDLHVIHASGDAAAGDKIYTISEGDETIANRGTFWLTYQGGLWIVDHALV